MGKDVVVQWLRAELYPSSDELGCGVGSERVDECITTGFPLVTTSETKLRTVSKKRNEIRRPTHISAWTPRVLFHAASTMVSLESHVRKRDSTC